MKAYHFLRADMTAGSGNEPPWTVGEERRVKGKLQMYAYGYHSSPTWRDALRYAPGMIASIVEVPFRGTLKDTDKQVSRRRKLIAARDSNRTVILWAAECAERPLLREREAGREPDKRSWKVIEVLRLFLDGKATQKQMSAARSAAYSAAYAARSAARSAAASATYAARSATYAAYCAAASAAASAAYAARSAADSAAASAAYAAYAAYAARSAADSAAASAAANAAASAADSAEKEWQANRLDEMMTALFEEAV